jgi:hypothetical protein
MERKYRSNSAQNERYFIDELLKRWWAFPNHAFVDRLHQNGAGTYPPCQLVNWVKSAQVLR